MAINDISVSYSFRRLKLSAICNTTTQRIRLGWCLFVFYVHKFIFFFSFRPPSTMCRPLNLFNLNSIKTNLFYRFIYSFGPNQLPVCLFCFLFVCDHYNSRGHYALSGNDRGVSIECYYLLLLLFEKMTLSLIITFHIIFIEFFSYTAEYPLHLLLI